MSDPQLAYCPICATPFVERTINGMPRATCPQCGFILFLDPKVVAIVVVRYQDQLLLGKRNNHPGQGRWTFFGGYVERGEKVEDAAIREVKEETLLDVQLAGLIGIYSQTGDTNILIAYQAHVLNEQINLQQMQAEEVSELALFPYDKLPELAFPIDKHILHDWQQLYH